MRAPIRTLIKVTFLTLLLSLQGPHGATATEGTRYYPVDQIKNRFDGIEYRASLGLVEMGSIYQLDPGKARDYVGHSNSMAVGIPVSQPLGEANLNQKQCIEGYYRAIHKILHTREGEEYLQNSGISSVLVDLKDVPHEVNAFTLSPVEINGGTLRIKAQYYRFNKTSCLKLDEALAFLKKSIQKQVRPNQLDNNLILDPNIACQNSLGQRTLASVQQAGQTAKRQIPEFLNTVPSLSEAQASDFAQTDSCR